MKLRPIGCFLGLLLIMPFFGLSQQTQIKIIDKITKEPVAYANLVISPMTNSKAIKGYISDNNGVTSVNINQKSVLRLSYVGYLDFVDTILPGIDKEISLTSISYSVDEVVVTGQYAASSQDKSIYKVSVLNSHDIEQKAATNIKEMLSTELNIRTSHDGALGSTLTMQGLKGEHIKILIDGVPVIGRENGNIDLDQINLQNIDHIEVINGPMSVVYGSNALAGVINIITKSPDRLLFSSNIDAYYESVGVYNLNMGASSSIKQHSFSFSGGRNFFDGYNPPGYSKYMGLADTSIGVRWKPKEQYNFSTNYKYTLNNGFVKFGMIWFSQELRDKGLLLPTYYETRIDKYFFTKRLVLKVDAGYEFSAKSRINLIASYSKYKKVKNTYLKDLTDLNMYLTPGQQDTTLFDNIMFRSDYSFGNDATNLQYQVGIDLNQEKGVGKRIEDDMQEIGDYAFYASLNYKPFAVVALQPGVRFIYNTKFTAPVIFSVNAKYDITDQFNVRATFARGFRAPSLKELYLDFEDINHKIYGNENLNAETSFNTSLIFQYNSRADKNYKWGLELNLFNNNIDDNIKLLPGIGDEYAITPYTYVNISRFITRGAELGFNNRIYPSLTIKFGFTIIGQKIEYINISNSDFEYYSDFNTSVNYWLRRFDINFSVYYKYSGKAPQLYFNEGNIEYGYMDSYNTLDVNASKWMWKRRINLQIGAKNLFDNTDIFVSGGKGSGAHSNSGSESVNWGRTFFIRLQFKFNK